MGINEEVNVFVDQTLKKFEAVAKKHGAAHFVIGTWLEPFMRDTLKDLYIQMKYICKYSRRNYIISQEFDYEKSDLVYRHGKILQKITFDPWVKIKDEFKENPFFLWQDYKIELDFKEYIDIIMSEIGALFEYYFSCLQNNVVFNCTELARHLDLDDLIPHITKAKNLRIFYDLLNYVASIKYGVKTRSLFPNFFYEVRNAVFHMDYYYEKLPPHNFRIYLNKEKSIEIKFDELIKLSQDIMSKVNSIKIIGHYFSKSKSNLPLNGY